MCHRKILIFICKTKLCVLVKLSFHIIIKCLDSDVMWHNNDDDEDVQDYWSAKVSHV